MTAAPLAPLRRQAEETAAAHPARQTNSSNQHLKPERPCQIKALAQERRSGCASLMPPARSHPSEAHAGQGLQHLKCPCHAMSEYIFQKKELLAFIVLDTFGQSHL